MCCRLVKERCEDALNLVDVVVGGESEETVVLDVLNLRIVVLGTILLGQFSDLSQLLSKWMWLLGVCALLEGGWCEDWRRGKFLLPG